MHPCLHLHLRSGFRLLLLALAIASASAGAIQPQVKMATVPTQATQGAKLVYAITPEVVYIGRESLGTSDASSVVVQVGAPNTKKDRQCFQLAVKLPVGSADDGDVLVTTVDGISAEAEDPWREVDREGGFFLFRPKGQGEQLGARCSVTFTFRNLRLSSRAGVATVNVYAWTAPMTEASTGYDDEFSKPISKQPSPAGIHSFTATPSRVTAGGSVELKWEVSGAGSLALMWSQTATPVDVTGRSSYIVQQDVPIELYTLTARSSGLSKTSSITVVANKPKVISFDTSAQKVVAGSTVTLTWKTTGADWVELEGLPGQSPDAVHIGPAQGKLDIKVHETTVLTLTAIDSQNSVRSSPAQWIVIAEQAGIEYFRADAAEVKVGQTVTLSWKAAAAASLAIEQLGLTDIKENPGSHQVQIREPRTFTLVARGIDGSVAKRDLMIAVFPAGKIEYHELIIFDDGVHRKWAVSNASNCRIGDDRVDVKGVVEESSHGRSTTLQYEIEYERGRWLRCTGLNGLSVESLPKIIDRR
jgi:plastocyanin